MFVCRLAGIFIGVEHQYPFVERLCRRYLAPAGSVPAFTVCAAEGRLPADVPVPPLPPDHRESAEIYRAICTRLLDFDALVLHAAAVAVDGQGYLFAAPSSTGKSTHARLWCERFGARAVLLNDDKPLLRLEEDGWRVYGTPWSGPYGRNENAFAPLRGICLLRQGEATAIRPLPPAQALPRLMNQTLRPADPARLDRLCRLVDQLLRACPVFDLPCTPDPSAVDIAYRVLSS